MAARLYELIAARWQHLAFYALGLDIVLILSRRADTQVYVYLVLNLF